MNRSIAKQILHLLKRSHEPLVTVKPSTITNAGSGVFSRRTIAPNEIPIVVSLYPGIFTPPLPVHAMRHSEYIANKIPPSYFCSEISMNDNAYILNLQGTGGYIDGCALNSQYCKASKLDENPSACGQLVNHDGSQNNVEVLDFSWDDIHLDQNEEPLYVLPNETRADGSPWYYDRINDEVVTFVQDDMAKSHGAAIVLMQPLDEGEELLLDYKLVTPYPKWAEDWYTD